jgi:hypothetical protein
MAGAGAVLAAVALAGCGGPSASSPPGSQATTTGPGTGHAVVYGVDVNQFDSDITPARVPRVLAMIARAGATAVRIGGDWAVTEPSPGHYDFSSIDRLFSLARSDGLTVLLELGNEPGWDAVGRDPSAPPVDCTSPEDPCTSVSSYVAALVAHAAPEGLRDLIVRNEPQNFAKNWVGGSAPAYAHFQQVVYQAAHRAEPGIAVLNGGTESISAQLSALQARLEHPTAYEREASAFAQSLYHDPAWCDSLDVLDVHVGDHGPRYSPQIVDDSEAALQACNGGRRVPVWVTEVGYPSIPALQSSKVYRLELNGAYQGGEAGQARYLTDTMRALAEDTNVVGIDWTFMIDPNTSQSVPPGTSYQRAASAGAGDGLAYASYRTKASYRAFEAVAGR